ncbi:cytochrome C [Algoriphagus lacus]|uniref:Cytochrome C n=1 Tax=Algoriphagus lacus TaxID=2056311 RepID=A0A418PS34_9BACT|nr:c-type cytochrome domain-containing protein [Algoriphagus lacus]RIW15703.1 cytochrome C [Algoriphagus lacus]
MKSKLTSIAERILFGGNCLLLFFLLFESYIHIPLWMQPIGRLHPVMLHFPIALLLLALFLELFRFKPEFRSQAFFQKFSGNLFLFSILTGLIAAIMGLFLAQEEGYSGQMLNWHKWSGAGMVFLASLVYAFRNYPWYPGNIANVGIGVTALSIILAGHFGSNLTHGENFILEPILANKVEQVPFEEAQVFDHLILPILESKCNSCHNPSKAKGELIMTTLEALLKGGENGVVFVGGKPEESPLLNRIHLPEEDEDHMPPTGKPQLTDSEKAILEQWIKSNLEPETLLVTLPESDELRIMAKGFFDSKTQELSFDFAEANPQTIQELNTSYRAVIPLAKDSPALDVVLFSPANFTSSSIDELVKVSEQVVALNLNKMPVKDQDIQALLRFENLIRLNLNYTEITGKGLVELVKLGKLQHLSISGTKVDLTSIQTVARGIESLKTMTVWETPLTKSELETLKNEFKQIAWIYGREGLDEEILQLNLPQLANASTIFKDTMALNIGHPIRDVEIRYTLDGTDPDKENSPKFVFGETVLTEGKLVKARAYKEGWSASEVATFNIYKNSNKPDTVLLLSKLSRVHPANGSKTFFDTELGTYNANSPAWANNWAGFRGNPMELLLEYGQSVNISAVSMRVLVEPSNVIFPPESIEIWGGDDPNSLRLVGKMRPIQPNKEGVPYIELITCDFKPVKAKYIKVVAKPVEKIGSWSKRKGGAGLLLVDELFVN